MGWAGSFGRFGVMIDMQLCGVGSYGYNITYYILQSQWNVCVWTWSMFCGAVKQVRYWLNVIITRWDLSILNETYHKRVSRIYDTSRSLEISNPYSNLETCVEISDSLWLLSHVRKKSARFFTTIAKTLIPYHGELHHGGMLKANANFWKAQRHSKNKTSQSLIKCCMLNVWVFTRHRQIINGINECVRCAANNLHRTTVVNVVVFFC